jgi:adenine-specific DNA-methyltransferase
MWKEPEERMITFSVIPDFGIYRMVGLKQNWINKFIEEKLPTLIKKELKNSNQSHLQNLIYNYLHKFFSRYYEKGNFIARPRYITPGNDILLYWSTWDQYYVKTDFVSQGGSRKKAVDFFIHKDLEGFLKRELEHFIRYEILDLNEDRTQLALVFKRIAEAVIAFLARIENIQKKLWLKRKFVLRTEYVITLDRIPFSVKGEILNNLLTNKAQIDEWRELLDLEEPLTYEFLFLHPFLYVDTKYLPEELKWKLLASFDNLEEEIQGILIKSENFQALNLLLGKYKEKVQTIYIDPPFNKESNANYLYNVKYKDSTWITLLENRLRLARDVLKDSGSIFVRCDYNGNMFVRLLMNEIFGEENFRNEIEINRTKKIFTGVKGYNVATDSLFFYTKKEDFNFYAQYKRRGQEQQWLNMHSPGERRPSERIIFGKLLYPPKGRHWTFIQETIDKMIKEGRIRIKEDVEYIDLMGNKVRGMPQYLTGEKELLDSNWTDIPGYSFEWNFRTENSEQLLQRVIQSTSNEGELVMDFFLGSGTTTAVAHKLQRKWIGIEVGDHFYSIILPRMKKVLTYDKSGISNEKDVKDKYNKNKAGGFFKYQCLEQYEDTLENIEFKREELDFIYNLPHKFIDPFNYKLKIRKPNGDYEEISVDLIETFNYLMGIYVKKLVSLQNKGKIYRIVLGVREETKQVAVIWRDITDMTEEDYKQEKEFLLEKLPGLNNYDEIYVNAKSALEKAQVLEELFIEKMWKEENHG